MRGFVTPATGAIASVAVVVSVLRGEAGAAVGAAAFAGAAVAGAALELDLRKAAGLLGGGAVAALAGLTVGGAPGAGAMVAAAAALSGSLAGLVRRAGASRSVAAFAAPFAVLLPCAFVFVADPWIEWRGSKPESARRAAAVYAASPLAALCSPRGGADVDWQRRGLLYDGIEERQVAGLSVIGQYYPSEPPSAWAWAAGLAAAAAACAALVQRSGGAGSRSSCAGIGGS